MAVRRRCGERGMALAGAVFALVVLAALLAGLWFAALQEYRVGANVVGDRRAFDAAEAGLEAVVAGWDAGVLNRLAIGDTSGFAGWRGGAGRYAGVVRRLGPRLFLIRSTGRDVRGSSRRTLAAVVRLAPLRFPGAAALVSSGRVRLGAGALVDALAADTAGACAAPGAVVPGILLAEAADLTLADCPGDTCLRGDPASRVDAALRGAAVPLLGEEGWAGLAAAAETVAASGALPSGSRVWLAPGDFAVPAGAFGPAVLLVQGDLIVETGAQLSGLVVVRGRLIMRGAGGAIAGSVVAAGADLTAAPGARAWLRYSGCQVEEGLVAAAPARPLRERWWSAVYVDAL